MKRTLVLLVLVGACAVTPGQQRQDALMKDARMFNDDWRWARWETMAAAMPAPDATAFRERVQRLEGEIELADFEVSSIHFLRNGTAAAVVARFDWYYKRDPVVHSTTVEESWEDQAGAWRVVKIRRTHGDRFGLVPEPAALPDAGQPQPGSH